METFLALLGGALLGQIGTVFTHLLGMRQDKKKAEMAEQSAMRQWEREEASRANEREHQILIREHEIEAKRQQEVRSACAELIRLAQLAINLDGRVPTFDEINDALAKVKTVMSPDTKLYGSAYRLAEVVESRVRFGRRDRDASYPSIDAERDAQVSVHAALFDMQESINC